MSDFTLLPPSAPSHWPNPAGSQRPEELTGSPEWDQGKEAGRGDEMNRKRMTDPGGRRHAAGTPPTSPSPACAPSLQKCPWPSGSPWTGKLCARPAPRPGPTTDSGGSPLGCSPRSGETSLLSTPSSSRCPTSSTLSPWVVVYLTFSCVMARRSLNILSPGDLPGK